jgi:hypothetical protein
MRRHYRPFFLPPAALCLALLLFFIANGLDAFLFRPYRDGASQVRSQAMFPRMSANA